MNKDRIYEIKSLLTEGAKIIKTQGIMHAFFAFLRLVNMNVEGYYYYLRYIFHSQIFSRKGSINPFITVEVDPKMIESSISHEIQRWGDIGKVIDGDWDQRSTPLSDLIKYRSLIDHFENETPWEKTDVYQEAVDHIESGETYWNGCKSIEDLDKRVEAVEDLYESMRKHGYVSQEARYGDAYKDIVLSRKFDRSKEEIAVAISRSNELLFVDGNHRLAISHVLSLDIITVHVIAAHPKSFHNRKDN